MNYKDYVACEDQSAYLNQAALHFRQGINELEISIEAGNDTLVDEHSWAVDILKCIENEHARIRRAMNRIESEESEKNALLYGVRRRSLYDLMDQGVG